MKTSIPHGPSDLICPLHRKAMSKTCHVCPWWMQLRGVNPNTNREIDEWSCAIGTLPMLLIENANQARQGGAATESFRNELVKVIALQMSGNRVIAKLPTLDDAKLLPGNTE